jgi:glycosyltransferase involved in cell wall biosynthesis
LGGRNGTREVTQAMQYVKSPIKLIIRSQVPIQEINDPRIEYRIGTFEDIWNEGDVFLFPEKFNGLSLPLQEAYASGMLVMAGNRHPMNLWLPNEPLIPIKHFKRNRISVEFDEAIYDPIQIAETIDLWYNKNIESFSLLGKKWGQENSWDVLKAKYLKILENNS